MYVFMYVLHWNSHSLSGYTYKTWILHVIQWITSKLDYFVIDLELLSTQPLRLKNQHHYLILKGMFQMGIPPIKRGGKIL